MRHDRVQHPAVGRDRIARQRTGSLLELRRHGHGRADAAGQYREIVVAGRLEDRVVKGAVRCLARGMVQPVRVIPASASRMAFTSSRVRRSAAIIAAQASTMARSSKRLRTTATSGSPENVQVRTSGSSRFQFRRGCTTVPTGGGY